jgi:UDP-N-acetylglucosamine transferase subunit ALG13
MIVVTVGTHEQPFDRLIRAVAALEGDEPLLVQYGSSQVAHGRGEWVDYMSFDALAERAAGARAFVCHAGVGSIVLARRCGHTPIVVPRRHELGEHVDDHQLSLARRLAKAGVVTMVEDVDLLADAIRDAGAAPILAEATPLRGKDALSAHLRGVLTGVGAAEITAARAA